MKKFLERMRCWLIKKLGGYTEQYTPVRRESIRLPDARAEKVRIQIMENRLMLRGHIVPEKYMKSKAIESIARLLVENGCIKWERTDSIEEGATIFQATLWVVRPEDLEPRFQNYVETHGN